MRARSRRLLISLLALLLVVLLAGCGVRALGENRLTIGYIEWDENVANSNLIKVILNDEFGYESVELKLVRVENVFQGLASGRLDAFTDAWMPNLERYHSEVRNKVLLSEEPWFVGETRYGIAVPDYMDAQSISDLRSSGATQITGIEPGAVLMERINNRVIPEYGLDLPLVEASTPAMLAELKRAYGAREPFVFLAWSPHWIERVYDFHYLEDPKNAMGRLDEPNELYSVVRRTLPEEDPVAYALINAMRLNERQVGSLGMAINKARSDERGARRWLERHRKVVQPWIEAAREAGG